MNPPTLVPLLALAVADDLAATAAQRAADRRASEHRLGCDSLPLDLLADLAAQRLASKAPPHV